MATTGDPRFNQVADLLGQAADKLGLSGGSLAAAGLVLTATKIATAAIQERAGLSPRQAAVFESFASTFIAAGVGAQAIGFAQLVDQVRTYGKLEAQRDALRNKRRQILSELAALGVSRAQYHLAEAELRGAEAAFSSATKDYMFARDMSLAVANLLVLNVGFGVVFAAITAVDHAINKKRHETMRRRRARAVAYYAISFANVYRDRDLVATAIAAFRAEEDDLYVDERIERLREIKALYGRDDHEDEVWFILTLPDQNFVDGLDSLVEFYEGVEGMSAAELDASVAAARRAEAAPEPPARSSLALGLAASALVAFLFWR